MEYYERNAQALQNEKDTLEKEASKFGNNAPMLYLLRGTTMVRILPAYSSAGVFFKQITKHHIRIGNQSEIFACPTMADMPCAICDKGQALTDSRNEADMEFARSNLRPRTQYLYNVLCYSAPANSKGIIPEFGKVYVMEAGVMVHRQIISLDQDAALGWADLTNLETGVNLIIKRTGSGLDTKYEVNPHGLGRTNLVTDCQARGIDINTLQLVNLEEVYDLPPAEKLEKLANSLQEANKSFHVPSPRPVLQTVSPAAAAVGAPATVVPAAPVPVAAPPSVVMPQPQVLPQPEVVQPSTTVVPEPPVIPEPPK